jgi:LysR family transcriptional regulator AphB
MDLNSLIILNKVAETGGFSSAARALKMPKSNVSLKISRLEEDLGLRLFERTTRKVRLTDEGRKVWELAQNVLDGVEQISATADAAIAAPKGTLKISAPYDISVYLIREVLPNFFQEYPDIHVDLDLSNRYVDLINEGFDLAIRATNKGLSDSSLVAMKLSSTSFGFFASKNKPDFEVKTISDLERVPVITLARPHRSKGIEVTNGRDGFIVRSTSQLMVNDMMAVKHAVVAGLGVGYLPEFVLTSESKRGDIIKVLPQWQGHEATFYAVYPSRRLLPPKTKVMLSYIKDAFTKNLKPMED